MYAKRFILQMTDITHKKEEAPEVNTVYTQTKILFIFQKTNLAKSMGANFGE